MITKPQITIIHVLLAKRGLKEEKSSVVLTYTNDRTSHVSEMTKREATMLIEHLHGERPKTTPENPLVNKTPKGDKMRKAIIAIFHDMNRPPQVAISWAEKQGVKGEKRAFNEYSNQELYVLITVAKKVRADYYDAVRKGLLQINNQ